MSHANWSFLLLLTALTDVARSQATVTIAVGEFYDPRTVNAFAGDVIEFVFESGTHGVTQTTFANPCSQVSGGFSSGLVQGFAPNSSLQSPIWSLTVTDASDPIYFYCQALVPSFHCSNGMVGGINVANDMYSSFSSAAKSLSGTPTQTMSAVLTGSGATASVTPFALAQTSGFIATMSSAASSPSSSSSSTPTSSSTSSAPTASTISSNSSSSKGAAIGGGIGGAVAVCIIGVLLFLLFRKRRNEPKEGSAWGGSQMGQKFDIASDTPYNRGTMFSNKTDQSDMYNNSVGLAYGPQESPQTAQKPQGTSYTAQQDYAGVGSGYSRDTYYGALHPQPSPPPQNAPVAGPSSGQERHSTFADNGAQGGSSTPAQGQGVDIHAIAKEVAALIVPHIRTARDSASESPSTSMPSLLNPHESPSQTVPRGSTPAPEYSSVTKRRL